MKPDSQEITFGVTLNIGEADWKAGQFLVKNKKPNTSLPDIETSDKSTKKPAPVTAIPEKPVEIGGPAGPEPTRYGDWEKAGRCSDF